MISPSVLRYWAIPRARDLEASIVSATGATRPFRATAWTRSKVIGAEGENTFQSIIGESVEKPFHLGCRGALLGQNASYPSRIHS
jgi:hypothetical protein